MILQNKKKNKISIYYLQDKPVSVLSYFKEFPDCKNRSDFYNRVLVQEFPQLRLLTKKQKKDFIANLKNEDVKGRIGWRHNRSL